MRTREKHRTHEAGPGLVNSPLYPSAPLAVVLGDPGQVTLERMACLPLFEGPNSSGADARGKTNAPVNLDAQR